MVAPLEGPPSMRLVFQYIYSIGKVHLGNTLLSAWYKLQWILYLQKIAGHIFSRVYAPLSVVNNLYVKNCVSIRQHRSILQFVGKWQDGSLLAPWWFSWELWSRSLHARDVQLLQTFERNNGYTVFGLPAMVAEILELKPSNWRKVGYGSSDNNPHDEELKLTLTIEAEDLYI